jgi:putative acetyltransferase
LNCSGRQVSEYWIAEEDGIIVGGCGVFATPGLPVACAELVKFYLSADNRGKGTGWRLMEKTFESAKRLGYKKLYLESLPELKRAISLYEKAGFKFISGPMGNSGHFGCDIWMLKDI